LAGLAGDGLGLAVAALEVFLVGSRQLHATYDERSGHQRDKESCCDLAPHILAPLLSGLC
jgi:hypothetical protein